MSIKGFNVDYFDEDRGKTNICEFNTMQQKITKKKYIKVIDIANNNLYLRHILLGKRKMAKVKDKKKF